MQVVVVVGGGGGGGRFYAHPKCGACGPVLEYRYYTLIYTYYMYTKSF